MDLAWIWHLSLFTGSRAGSAHGQQRGPHTIGSAWPRGCSCKPCPRARRGGEGAARPHGTPCAVCCACSPTRVPEHSRAIVPVSVQGSARSLSQAKLPQEQVPAPSSPCRCQLGAGRCLPSPRGWVGPRVAAWTPVPAPGQHLCLLPVMGLAGSTCWLGRWIMRLRSGVGSTEVPVPLPPPELLPWQPAGGSARCCDRDMVPRGCS